MFHRYKKPKCFEFNLVVVGAGSAGLVAAYMAASMKAKVALIEKDRMGGDCLHTGCVPSKTFLHSARVLSHLRRSSEYGLGSAEVAVDFSKVMQRVRSVVEQIAPKDSVERYSKLGVKCFSGEAFLRSPYEVEVDGRCLTTKAIILATGANPFVPDISGLEEVGYLTTDTVWALDSLPKRLVILGGGPVGCELGQAFSRFGSQVTLVEKLPRILPREDEEGSHYIQSLFEGQSISIFTSHHPVRCLKENKNKILVCEKDGREVRIECDELLLALGRKAHTTGLGLEALGIEISGGGTLVTDPYLRTQIKNIYACGDVVGPFQLTHAAAHQAWHATANALLAPFKRFRVDYRVLPWCTFTDPEVARVGLNEIEANSQKISYEITRQDFGDLDRDITEGATGGFVKVLTVPGKDKILGACIVGSRAGESIIEFVSAMKHGIGLKKILGTIHPYPTFSESNRFVAGNWRRAHLAPSLLKSLELFHSFRRR